MTRGGISHPIGAPREGVTLVEILVATGIFLAFFGGVYRLLTVTTLETSQAIHYLRALQLAQEAMDWATTTIPGEKSNGRLAGQGGSLVAADTLGPAALPVAAASGPTAVPGQDFLYPKQYGTAWFYRRIRLSPARGQAARGYAARGPFSQDRLFELTVDVFWNEGQVPARIESFQGEPDRMRKITLSTLVYDERLPD